MIDELPPARELRHLSPSSYEALRSCPQRVAFSQAGGGRSGGVRGDAARVGDACHEVLQSLVDDGLLRSSAWQEHLSIRWDERLSRQEAEAGHPLRGARLAGARLRKVSERMAAVLSGVSDSAEMYTELELTAADGRFAGKLDLAIRSDTVHAVLDYKTGSVTEPGGQEIKARYRRQLMLYACLEAETAGWPDWAVLVPFGADPLRVEVNPRVCQDLLHDVLAALDEWQHSLEQVPPAHPGPDTCHWCPYAARCGAFWAASDPQWSGDLLAARGRISAVSRAPLGGLTFHLASEQGSVRGDVAVRNVDPNEHPELARAIPRCCGCV